MIDLDPGTVLMVFDSLSTVTNTTTVSAVKSFDDGFTWTDRSALLTAPQQLSVGYPQPVNVPGNVLMVAAMTDQHYATDDDGMTGDRVNGAALNAVYSPAEVDGGEWNGVSPGFENNPGLLIHGAYWPFLYVLPDKQIDGEVSEERELLLLYTDGPSGGKAMSQKYVLKKDEGS